MNLGYAKIKITLKHAYLFQLTSLILKQDETFMLYNAEIKLINNS